MTEHVPPPTQMSYGPRYFLDNYREQLKVGMAVMLQYRFAVLIWGVWGFVGPLVSLAVWTAVAGSGIVSNGATSFNRAEFSAYFLVFMVFGHVTMSWDAFEYGMRVRNGALSPHLLKPLEPIHRDAAQNISFKVVTSSMLIPVWILLWILLKPAPPVSLEQALLSIPSLALAAVMRYVWQYALACLAFWTTRVEAVNQLWFAVDSFLGGRVAPLALLPGWLGTLAYFSPFRSMGSFPVELALGRVPPDQVLPGFLLQLAWLAGGILVFRVIWAAGIRQYSAVGA